MTEAAVFRCQACGASVGEGDVQCPYCKSQLATVACPRCFGMVSIHARHCSHCGQAILTREQGEDSPVRCPVCDVPLVITSLGDAKIHQCHTCGGLWLAKETFDNLAANHEIRGQAIGVLPGEKPQGKRLSSETVYYRPCPCCGKLMNRLNYARISKVIVDVCKDHGIWFDQDELRQVLAFIDSGGLVRAQERERLHLEEERSRVAMQSMGGLPAMADPDTPVLMRSDWSGVIETGSLLGKIAVGAFETLLGQFKR